jgi:hypothetical protein
MNITMFDDSVAFDGASPDARALGGGEKAFARLAAALAARGHWVTAINRCQDPIQVDGVDWLPWNAPRPPDTDVLIAFRKPVLLDEVDDAEHRCLWLWDGRKSLDRPKNSRIVARRDPTLVLTGVAHLAALNFWPGQHRKVIQPGVGAAFLKAEGPEPPAAEPIAVVTTHPLQGLTRIVSLWSARIHPGRPGAVLRIYSAGLWRGLEGGAVEERMRPVVEAVRAASEQGVEVRPPLADPGMATVYRQAAVHLYPMIKGEIYGSTLAESQAAGAPAILHATDGASPALLERIENGRTGYLAPDDDAFVNLTEGLLEPGSEMYKSLSDAGGGARQARGWDDAAIEFEALWK